MSPHIETSSADDGADVAGGERIRLLRQTRNFKQSDFSSFVRSHGLNWSQATLSKIESGARPVRLAEALILSKRLGVTLDWLAGIDGDDGSTEWNQGYAAGILAASSVVDALAVRTVNS